MCEIIKTNKRKRAAYMKLSKKELVELLIEANELLARPIMVQPVQPYVPNITPPFTITDWELPNPPIVTWCDGLITDGTTTTVVTDTPYTLTATVAVN